MKIIGIIDGRRYYQKYIAEVTLEELTRIAGSPHEIDAGIGTVVNVHESFSRLANLNGNRETVKKARDSLRALADLMEPLGDVVSLVEEPKPEDDDEDGAEE